MGRWESLGSLKSFLSYLDSAILDLTGGSDGKASAYNMGDSVPIPGREDPLEKEMATHSSTLAWKMPWMEKPGRLQSMGLQRVGHHRATLLSFFLSAIWGQYLAFSHLEFPEGSPWGVTVWWLLDCRDSLFLSCFPSGLTAVDCDIFVYW